MNSTTPITHPHARHRSAPRISSLWGLLLFALTGCHHDDAAPRHELLPAADADVICEGASQRMCSWFVQPIEVRQRQGELLDWAAQQLSQGVSPAQVAGELEGMRDVTRVRLSANSLDFTIQGGMSVNLWLTRPLRPGPRDDEARASHPLRQPLVIGRRGLIEPRRHARAISPYYFDSDPDLLFDFDIFRFLTSDLEKIPDYRGRVRHIANLTEPMANDLDERARVLAAFHNWQDEDVIVLVTHGNHDKETGLAKFSTGLALWHQVNTPNSSAEVCDQLLLDLDDPGLSCGLIGMDAEQNEGAWDGSYTGTRWVATIIVNTDYLRAHRSGGLTDQLLFLLACFGFDGDTDALFAKPMRGALLSFHKSPRVEQATIGLFSMFLNLSRGASVQEAFLTSITPHRLQGTGDNQLVLEANQELHMREIIELFDPTSPTRRRLEDQFAGDNTSVEIKRDEQGLYRTLELGVRLFALNKTQPNLLDRAPPDNFNLQLSSGIPFDQANLEPLIADYRTEIWRTDEVGQPLALLAAFSHDPEAHTEHLFVDDWTQEITFTLELDEPVEEGDKIHLAAVTTIPQRFSDPLPGEDLTSTHHVTLTAQFGSPCTVTLTHEHADLTEEVDAHQLLASTHGAHVVGQVDLMTHDPAHFWGRLGVSGEHFDFWGETTPGARAPLLGGFSPPDAQVPLGFQEGAFIELLDVTPALGEDGQPRPEEEALRKRYRFHAPLRPVTASVTEPLTGHVEGHLDVITTHDPDHHGAPWGISCDRNLQDF